MKVSSFLYIAILLLNTIVSGQDQFTTYSFETFHPENKIISDTSSNYQWITSPFVLFENDIKIKKNYEIEIGSIVTNIKSLGDPILLPLSMTVKKGKGFKTGIKFEWNASNSQLHLGNAALGASFSVNDFFKWKPNILVPVGEAKSFGISLVLSSDYKQFLPDKKYKYNINNNLTFVYGKDFVDKGFKIKHDLLLTHISILKNNLSLLVKNQFITHDIKNNWYSNLYVGYFFYFDEGPNFLISAGTGILGSKKQENFSLFLQLSFN